MTTTFVGARESDLLKAGERFRATWAATAIFSGLPFLGADLTSNMQALFDGRITGTRLAFPISKPVVRDGDKAGTIDLQVMQEAARNGATVGQLARALEAAATIGRNLELVRLERYTLGGGSQADVEGRVRATQEGQQAADSGGLGGIFESIGKFYRGTSFVIAAGAVLGLAVWLTVKRKAGSVDWL